MQMQSKPIQRIRMPFIDGLRGLAAVAVLLPHAIGLFYFSVKNPISQLMIRVSEYGHYGVEVFFVISGFVIAYSLKNTVMTGKNWGKFILRRSIRLDPPYWVAIAFTCGLYFLGTVVTKKPLELPSGAKLLAHVLYLQDILQLGQINVAFWTLCIEFQFYCAFAVLFWAGLRLTKQQPQRTTAYLSSGVFLLSLLWPSRLIRFASGNYWLTEHAYIFLAGALTWWALSGRVRKLFWYLAILFLILLFCWRQDGRVFITVSVAVLLFWAGQKNRLFTWLNINVCQLYGRISYSFYLVHIPICLVCLALRNRVGSPSILISLMFFGLLFFLSTAAAYGLHICVERRCQEWSHSFVEMLSKFGLRPSLAVSKL